MQRNRINKDPALFKQDEVIRYLNAGKSYKNRMTRWKHRTHYHKHSLVETTMSRLKYLFGDNVRSRKFENQATDLKIRCAIINTMDRLGMPETIKVT